MIKFQCGQCGKHLHVEAPPGTRVGCPVCGHRMVLPQPSQDGLPGQPAPNAAPPGQSGFSAGTPAGAGPMAGGPAPGGPSVAAGPQGTGRVLPPPLPPYVRRNAASQAPPRDPPPAGRQADSGPIPLGPLDLQPLPQPRELQPAGSQLLDLQPPGAQSLQPLDLAPLELQPPRALQKVKPPPLPPRREDSAYGWPGLEYEELPEQDQATRGRLARLAADCFSVPWKYLYHAGWFGYLLLGLLLFAAISGIVLAMVTAAVGPSKDGSTTVTILIGSVILVMSLWLLGVIGRCVSRLIAAQASGLAKPNKMPGLDPLGCLVDGLRVLGLNLVYNYPLVTLPLLPLGWLAYARTQRARSLDAFWAIRVLWNHPGHVLTATGIALFWALLSAGLIWAEVALFRLLLPRHWYQSAPGASLFPVLTLLFLMVLLLTIMTGIIMFCRCVGRLAYHCPQTVRSLCEPEDTISVAAAVGLGIVLSAAAVFVQYQAGLPDLLTGQSRTRTMAGRPDIGPYTARQTGQAERPAVPQRQPEAETPWTWTAPPTPPAYPTERARPVMARLARAYQNYLAANEGRPPARVDELWHTGTMSPDDLRAAGLDPSDFDLVGQIHMTDNDLIIICRKASLAITAGGQVAPSFPPSFPGPVVPTSSLQRVTPPSHATYWRLRIEGSDPLTLKSEFRLRNLAGLLEAYRSAHGSYPPDLETLRRGQWLYDPQDLNSPNPPHHPLVYLYPDRTNRWLAMETQYFHPALEETHWSRSPVAVRADGEVREISMSEALGILKRGGKIPPPPDFTKRYTHSEYADTKALRNLLNLRADLEAFAARHGGRYPDSLNELRLERFVSDQEDVWGRGGAFQIVPGRTRESKFYEVLAYDAAVPHLAIHVGMGPCVYSDSNHPAFHIPTPLSPEAALRQKTVNLARQIIDSRDMEKISRWMTEFTAIDIAVRRTLQIDLKAGDRLDHVPPLEVKKETERRNCGGSCEVEVQVATEEYWGYGYVMGDDGALHVYPGAGTPSIYAHPYILLSPRTARYASNVTVRRNGEAILERKLGRTPITSEVCNRVGQYVFLNYPHAPPYLEIVDIQTGTVRALQPPPGERLPAPPEACFLQDDHGDFAELLIRDSRTREQKVWKVNRDGTSTQAGARVRSGLPGKAGGGSPLKVEAEPPAGRRPGQAGFDQLRQTAEGLARRIIDSRDKEQIAKLMKDLMEVPQDVRTMVRMELSPTDRLDHVPPLQSTQEAERRPYGNCEVLIQTVNETCWAFGSVMGDDGAVHVYPGTTSRLSNVRSPHITLSPRTYRYATGVTVRRKGEVILERNLPRIRFTTDMCRPVNYCVILHYPYSPPYLDILDTRKETVSSLQPPPGMSLPAPPQACYLQTILGDSFQVLVQDPRTSEHKIWKVNFDGTSTQVSTGRVRFPVRVPATRPK